MSCRNCSNNLIFRYIIFFVVVIGTTSLTPNFKSFTERVAEDFLDCPDRIHVSLNQNCQSVLRPYILHDDTTWLASDVSWTIIDKRGRIFTTDTIDRNFLGQCVTVVAKVIPTGNKCWFEACIEDKLAPSVLCQNDTITCFERHQLPDAEALAAAMDNCGQSVTILPIDEEFEDYDCDSALFTGKITRRIIAQDPWYRTTSCYQQIWLERLQFDSVRCPSEIVEVPCIALPKLDSLAGSDGFFLDPSILLAVDLCVDSFFNADIVPMVQSSVSDTSHPMWTPRGHMNFCNLLTSYEDEWVWGSGFQLTVMRRWWIADWCEFDFTSCTQFIEVENTNCLMSPIQPQLFSKPPVTEFPILSQNRPNPFSDQTKIDFYVPEEEQVILSIWDVSGELLMTIDEKYTAGFHSIEIGGDEIPGTGVLIYQLRAGDFVDMKRMVLMR